MSAYACELAAFIPQRHGSTTNSAVGFGLWHSPASRFALSHRAGRASGQSDQATATRLAVNRHSVRLWRQRFAQQQAAVGFDMVLEPPNFLVGSDGGEVRAPPILSGPGKKLRRAQQHLSRTKRDSRNRTKARRRVG